MKSDQLYELIRNKTELKTDYAIAKALGISQTAISKAKKNGTQPNIYTLFKAADILEKEPIKFLIENLIQNESNEKKKKYWEEKAKQLITFPMVALWIALSTTSNTKISNNSITYQNQDATMYIMLNRILNWVKDWWILRCQSQKYQVA